MKRRDFLKGTAAGGGAAILASCGAGSESEEGAGDSKGPAVVTGKKIRWRLASSFPRGLDTIYGASETLAKLVESMSGGKFQIRPYPAGELVPGLQVMDAVQQSTVQVGHTASYYYTGKNPAFAFDTSIPFGLSARQQMAWLTEAGGADVLAPLFSDFKIKRFIAGNTGAQMGGWFKREIATPEDIKGLKIRIPGLGGEVMSRMGATVQVLAGGDIYPALERGAIDATEWIGPCDDEKLGFHKVAKYYYYPGWWEPGPALTFMVGQDAWDKLPAEYQSIFESAAMAASTQMQARYDALNPPALARLRKAGVQFRSFSPEVMTAARTQSEALLQENAAKDAGYKKIFDHWSAFRKESFEWFGMAEQAYAAFAFKGE